MTRTKQEVVTEFRCSEILEAARKTFAVQGFAATTMDAIAEQAHIAKGTLYLYFPSKRDIYLAALRQGIRLLNDDTMRKVTAASGVLGKLRTFVATRVDTLSKPRVLPDLPTPRSVTFCRIRQQAGSQRALPGAFPTCWRILCAKRRSGESATSAPRDGISRVRFTRGVIVQRMLGWSKAALQDDIDHLITVLWRGIAA